MKQLILAIALAAALGSAHAEQNAPSLSKVNGSLTAEAGKAYGDLDTVNGSITVEEKAAARHSRAEEAALLDRVRAAFRVHRSGIVSLAEKWLALEDFQAIRQRMIGIGSVGGKALGMLVARSILRKRAPEVAARLEVHDSP